jgi:hypothetical protein
VTGSGGCSLPTSDDTRTRGPATAAVVSRLGYRPKLDGVRGVAILLVMLVHVHNWPRGGFIGVDVFFTLSGFLITTLLLEEWQARDKISLRNFYARRALRLFPAVVVLLVAYFDLCARGGRLISGDSTGRSRIWIHIFVELGAGLWTGVSRTGDRLPVDAGHRGAILPPVARPAPARRAFRPVIRAAPDCRNPLCGRGRLGMTDPACRRRSGRTTHVFRDRCAPRPASAGRGSCRMVRSTALLGSRFAGIAPCRMGRRDVPDLAVVRLRLLPLVVSDDRPGCHRAGVHGHHHVRDHGLLCSAQVDAQHALAALGRALSYSLYLWHVPAIRLVEGSPLGQFTVLRILGGISLSFVLAAASCRYVEQERTASASTMRRTTTKARTGGILCGTSDQEAQDGDHVLSCLASVGAPFEYYLDRHPGLATSLTPAYPALTWGAIHWSWEKPR